MEIRRILLHPDTVRRMVEPDFEVKRPDGCNDALMLYATTEQTDYEPLFQTAIELSPHLSTRGIFTPDVCTIKKLEFDNDDFSVSATPSRRRTYDSLVTSPYARPLNYRGRSGSMVGCHPTID